MRNFTLLVIAAFASLLSSSLLAATPGFDCDKANLPVEKLICASDSLAQQDLKLTRLYDNVRDKLSDDETDQLRAEQIQWLQTRNSACDLNSRNSEQCLLDLYLERNRQLAAKLAFDSADRPPQSPLKILRVTPAGDDVLAGRQVVFQFDRPVVPIGRMERDSNDIPVTITPALNCEWRWLNTSALACQLRQEDQMRQATTYEVLMQPGIATENGEQIEEVYSHSFTTTLPRASYTRFVNWLTPGTPLIQVTFNQPVTKDSVENALSFRTNDSDNASVPIFVFPDNLPRRIPWWRAITDEQQQPLVDDQLTSIAGEEARRIWLIEPQAELPLDTNMLLTIVPGLESSEGPERGREDRVVVAFDTYPEFELIGVRCTLKGRDDRQEITWNTLKTFSKDSEPAEQCTPLNTVALVFSAPVLPSIVKNHVTFSPPLDGGREDYDPWQNTRDYTNLTAPHRKGRNYQVWLPELLKAYQLYSVEFDLQNFKDEFERTLKQNNDFVFQTSHREPNLKLNHNFAVLEQGVESDVPVYVTNLDRVTVNHNKLTADAGTYSLSQNLKVLEAQDIAYAIPLGVRDLLGDDTSGAIFGTVHPEPTPPRWYRDPEILAQVTPFQVHFKFGHFNSLAWVTRLDDGSAVANADISLWRGSYPELPRLQNLNVTATTDASGIALLPGIAELDPLLQYIWGGARPNNPGFFAKVTQGDAMALVPLNGSFSVRSNGVYPRLQRKHGHAHAWGTTAQGVYKLGDTVQFKLYLRDQSNRHWVGPEKSGYKLQVIDPQSKVVFEAENISLNEFGAYDGEFKVPEQGAVGWYNFTLTADKVKGFSGNNFSWTPMSVLVSDFTPSPFKVKAELNGELFTANDQVTAAALATLHSGGAFTKAEVRLTAKLQSTYFASDNPLTKGFYFGSGNVYGGQTNLLDIRDKLDDLGQYENVFVVPDSNFYYGKIMLEAAVKDDRGKFVAASTSADFAGRDRYVGLKNTSWLYEQGKKATIEALVLNQNDELIAGENISIVIRHRENKVSRVKGPGNAYLTQNIMEWVEESTCTLSSGAEPVACDFEPQHPGYYQITANIQDTKNRTHSTTINAWVTGRANVVWEQRNDAGLEIIPEQNQYNIGDTARYLIKNPYPGAKALISVERYGVLDSWVETFDTSTPVIEVPIKPDYLPGYYLSVVVVSPRVEKPLGPNNVDLGKPAYRIGYLSANVVDPYKQLDITLDTDKDVYKPREKVTAKIQIDKNKLNQGEKLELAVAVVDESVLALNRSGAKYYDPYAGFNRLDALDLNNYSLIARLVGRQKFEKKGANPGGGGGSGSTSLRNLFKFVSYWNPSITPDDNGEATIEFEVPDNLTGWRILAFAVTPEDKMGLGDVNFKVNRPTEIRPVMPNQVIEGDDFKAGFSIMNRTDKDRNIQLTVNVEGPLAEDQDKQFTREVTLAAYERKNVWLPIQTEGDGQLTFIARGVDNIDGDALQHSFHVNKYRSLETAANYGTTTADSVTESVKIPEGIYEDAGYVGAVFSPSVIGNLDGAFKYLKDYAYWCWEQRLTRATAADSYLRLKEYLQESIEWPDAESDIVNTLESATNFQAPNGGMVYWVPKNEYVSPYLSAYTAMAFNWLRRDGYEIPKDVENRLHTYLLSLLRRDEFPTFYSAGMASSVRAVALAALSESGKINGGDVSRYQRHVTEMDLFGKAHFLQAAIKTQGVNEETVQQTLNVILGHASQSGGKFQFNEPWDDSYKYLLATPLRSNCTVLSSLMLAQTQGNAVDSVADIPFKLVRSITQSRGNRDHWENTQENVFCLNALIDYAQVYEVDATAMQVELTFDGEKLGATAFNSKADSLVSITRELKPGDAGLGAKLNISRKGEGRLYYSARVSYALREENSARINSGIEIRREYSVERDGKFELLQSPMDIKRGELVRVDLFVSVPTARHFVVVNDPIPGGLEPVNTDLATASQVDADKGAFKAADGSWFYNFSDWSYYGRYFWSFYHKELRHDSARFYADYLPAGNYHLSYAAQAIAEGTFKVMPVHTEEMYDPDVYGKGLPATLRVVEQQ